LSGLVEDLFVSTNFIYIIVLSSFINTCLFEVSQSSNRLRSAIAV
jgi:hypothetical protein